MDAEINCSIEKTSCTFDQLSVTVWDNPKLAIRTKLAVYCVCSTLTVGLKIEKDENLIFEFPFEN